MGLEDGGYRRDRRAEAAVVRVQINRDRERVVRRQLAEAATNRLAQPPVKRAGAGLNVMQQSSGGDLIEGSQQLGMTAPMKAKVAVVGALDANQLRNLQRQDLALVKAADEGKGITAHSHWLLAVRKRIGPNRGWVNVLSGMGTTHESS